jgi:hypothetical protein
MGLSLLSAGAILVLQAPIDAQTEDLRLPSSLERIRAGLSVQPSQLPLLPVPAPLGDLPLFRAEVTQRVLQPPAVDPPFDPTYGLPSAGELLMNGIGSIKSAVVSYRRGRAERQARKEVEDALAAFCTVHECPTAATNK